MDTSLQIQLKEREWQHLVFQDSRGLLVCYWCTPETFSNFGFMLGHHL